MSDLTRVHRRRSRSCGETWRRGDRRS